MSGRRVWQREFFQFPGTGESVRIGFDLDHGRVTDFIVQLECLIDGRWRPVARYDTAHGFAHRDILGWRGEVLEKTSLPHEWDRTKAFDHAVADLAVQAKTYRDEFLRRKP